MTYPRRTPFTLLTLPPLMSERPIQITSINVNRCNTSIVHPLLQKSSFDILLLQEPWVGTINVQRDDADPTGVDVIGTAHNNMWECFLPPLSATGGCRVVTYIRHEVAVHFL